jgi:ferredoxin
MTRVRFVAADGETVREVTAAPGDRLLDLAQADGQPLEGTCEGQMACSTCHVIVAAEDFALLPPASEEEEDMLDLAAGATRTSRLACQVRIEGAWDALTVRIPAEKRDMTGRG